MRILCNVSTGTFHIVRETEIVSRKRISELLNSVINVNPLSCTRREISRYLLREVFTVRWRHEGFRERSRRNVEKYLRCGSSCRDRWTFHASEWPLSLKKNESRVNEERTGRVALSRRVNTRQRRPGTALG